MATKIASHLHMQRENGKFCDIEFELQSGFSAYGHFCVIAPQSDFVGGEHFLQKALKFSIHNPLKIKIQNFACEVCFRKLLDYFYMDSIEIMKEHEEHFRKLSQILEVPNLRKFFELDERPDGDMSPKEREIRVAVENDFAEKQNYFKITNKKSLAAKASHNSKYNYCTDCDFKSYKVSATLAHLKICKKQTLTCCLCDLGFFTSRDYFGHLQRHEDEKKPFFCIECNVKFSTKAALNVHTPKHSLEAPFKCPHCSKAFKWKHGLSTHLLSHNHEKQMLCDICGWSTSHMKALRAHKRTHTGELFKCPHPGCNHKTTRKENLKIHQTTHSNERSFVCEVCGCKFSQSKNLKRHSLIHNGDKGRIWKCQLCSFATYRSDKLKEHIEDSHTEKPMQLELAEDMAESFEPDDLDTLISTAEKKKNKIKRKSKPKEKQSECLANVNRPIVPKLNIESKVQNLTVDEMVETMLVEVDS